MAAFQPKSPILNPASSAPAPPFIPAASPFSHTLSQPLLTNGSWKSKLFDSINPSSSRTLVYLEPSVEGIKQIASCRRIEIERIAKEWEGKLMGFLLGKKRPHLPSLKKAMVSKWSLKCSLDLSFHGSDAILLNFGSDEEKVAVLDLGPWFFSGRLLVLKPWRRHLKKSDFDTSSIPIWVRFPNLPVEFWSKDSLSRIGSLLGRPLFSDEMTASRARSSYARICVEISASEAFPSEILVDIEGSERFSQKIQVEWKPARCDTCSVFFHDSISCPLSKNSSVVQPSSHIPVTAKGKEVWTVVHNRKNGNLWTSHAGPDSSILQKGGRRINSRDPSKSQGLLKPPVVLPMDVLGLNQTKNDASESGLLFSPEVATTDICDTYNTVPVSELQIRNLNSGGSPAMSDDPTMAVPMLNSTISEIAQAEGGVPFDSSWKGGVPVELSPESACFADLRRDTPVQDDDIDGLVDQPIFGCGEHLEQGSGANNIVQHNGSSCKASACGQAVVHAFWVDKESADGTENTGMENVAVDEADDGANGSLSIAIVVDGAKGQGTDKTEPVLVAVEIFVEKQHCLIDQPGGDPVIDKIPLSLNDISISTLYHQSKPSNTQVQIISNQSPNPRQTQSCLKPNPCQTQIVSNSTLCNQTTSSIHTHPTLSQSQTKPNSSLISNLSHRTIIPTQSGYNLGIEHVASPSSLLSSNNSHNPLAFTPDHDDELVIPPGFTPTHDDLFSIKELTKDCVGRKEGCGLAQEEDDINPPGFNVIFEERLDESSFETVAHVEKEPSDSEEEVLGFSSARARMIREKLGISFSDTRNADKAFYDFCRNRQMKVETNRKKSVVPDVSINLRKQVGKRGVLCKVGRGRKKKAY